MWRDGAKHQKSLFRNIRHDLALLSGNFYRTVVDLFYKKVLQKMVNVFAILRDI